jgi:hypothetical protein
MLYRGPDWGQVLYLYTLKITEMTAKSFQKRTILAIVWTCERSDQA